MTFVKVWTRFFVTFPIFALRNYQGNFSDCLKVYSKICFKIEMSRDFYFSPALVFAGADKFLLLLSQICRKVLKKIVIRDLLRGS